ncbi:MAG: MarR family winged helix-turn-helix transcriptional regulator [Clostridiales bacterium]|nr:MarR family winged helix-turn-helix transcriptional regulator [Clostridiales bacterium]
MELELLTVRQSTYHLYNKMFEKILKEFNITQLEADILLFLDDNKKCDTASSIISARHLSKSHVSSSVESLVCHGFITRNKDENNQKVVHLKLTEKAKPIIVAGHKVQKEFNKKIFDGISEKDAKILTATLDKINKNATNEYKKYSK